MRRTQTDEILLEAFDYRVKILESLNSLDKIDNPGLVVSSIQDQISKICDLLGENRVQLFYKAFGAMVEAFKHLVSWKDAIKKAELGSDRFYKAYQMHLKEGLKIIETSDYSGYFKGLISDLGRIDSADDLEIALKIISGVSLPLPVNWEKNSGFRVPSRRAQEETKIEIPKIFMEFKINGKDISNPHPIKPDHFYDLELEIRLRDVPKTIKELIIRPIADISPSNFEMPEFKFFVKEGHGVYQAKGRMKVNCSQTYESEPIEFVYQACCMPGDNQMEIIGNNTIKVRSNILDHQIVSGYTEANQPLLYIRSAIDQERGIPHDQKNNFLLLMKCLTNIAGYALAHDNFKGNLSEDEFQKKLSERLSSFQEIGSELVFHPKTARGVTDLYYRKIVPELKVEDKADLVLEDIKKFVHQATAYTSGMDSRLGILCVLDKSAKKRPAGSLANDIGMVKIMPTSFVSGPFPTLVGVVIIRANLVRPSDLSR